MQVSEDKQLGWRGEPVHRPWCDSLLAAPKVLIRCGLCTCQPQGGPFREGGILKPGPQRGAGLRLRLHVTAEFILLQEVSSPSLEVYKELC